MTDGTISFADGLGHKALDSNEVRRRQQLSDFSKAQQSHLVPSDLESSKMDISSAINSESLLKHRGMGAPLNSESTAILPILGSEPENPNLKRPMHDFSVSSPAKSSSPRTSNPSPSGVGSRSPKSGTARKMQQALFEEALLMEAEDRARYEQQQQQGIPRPSRQSGFEEGLVQQTAERKQNTFGTALHHQQAIVPRGVVSKPPQGSRTQHGSARLVADSIMVVITIIQHSCSLSKGNAFSYISHTHSQNTT